jgi:hypothetical protein
LLALGVRVTAQTLRGWHDSETRPYGRMPGWWPWGAGLWVGSEKAVGGLAGPTGIFLGLLATTFGEVQPPDVVALIGQAGGLICICLFFTIMLTGRPKALVMPHLRPLPSAFAYWADPSPRSVVAGRSFTPTWGDTVRVLNTAPPEALPGSVGSIVGAPTGLDPYYTVSLPGGQEVRVRREHLRPEPDPVRRI